MKVAPKVILLFNDSHGSGAAIFSALRPRPNSDLQHREEPFQLSLEKYGIHDLNASGKILHFESPTGVYEVSVLLLESYEPPILACAVSETLAALASGESSSVPTIVVPFVVPGTKLRAESKFSATTDNTQIYGLQFGPSNDETRALSLKFPNPPPSLQIFHEQLACFLQFVRVLMLPTIVLIGKTGQGTHSLTSDEQLQAIYQIGEHLASFSPLCLSSERITLEFSVKVSRENEEPWRALYG
ncbi:hypothetical protein DM860_009077 [Cuscuta australis]|uniref:DUF7894 domain-containing protein n=1 Tax=Cuscuta australis TaxID=267555 RepID=A0A328D871_9ASTE|nr:hypothetical protein DM860_009077 [Cuscuta australis]